MTVQDKYEEQCILHEGWGGNSDMYEHMPVLKAYSRECNHITELGVRWVVSTWAFLAAKPQDLVCMDIVHPSHWGEEFRYRLDEVKKLSGDTNFKFIQARKWYRSKIFGNLSLGYINYAKWRRGYLSNFIFNGN